MGFFGLGCRQPKRHNRGIPWKLEFTADTAPITPPSGTATSYKITATAGIGGTISPCGTTTVSAAGQLTYTIKANEGYYIADVKVDGSEVTATTSYTFSDVNTDHTIEVTFKQEKTPDVPDVITKHNHTA